VKKTYLQLSKVTGAINNALGEIQVVSIILAAVMVTADVLMRALFSKPIAGTSEYVGYIMILASYFGLGMCTANRSHLKVDLLVQLLPEKAQIVNDMINAVLVVAVASIMLYASVNQGLIAMRLMTRGTFSKVPNWPFYMFMGLGYLPVVLCAVNNFIEDMLLLGAKKPSED